MHSFKDKKQKIALIGCGYWGTIIAKTLNDLKFQNIIIFDSNIHNAITLQKKNLNLKICEKYSEILNDDMVKNIFFATPPSVNFKIVKMALNFKKIFF